MIRARLLHMTVRIKDIDGLDIEEILQWVGRGCSNFCKFEWSEIEFNREEQDGGDPVFSCKILLTKKKEDPAKKLEAAMIEFCHFEKADVKVVMDIPEVIINDDYTMPLS